MEDFLSELGEVTLKRAHEDLETDEGRKRLEDGLIHAHRLCIYLFDQGKLDSHDMVWFSHFMKQAYDELYKD